MTELSRSVANITIAIAFAGILQSCGGSVKDPPHEDVLMIMGDSVLTMQDVVNKIPVGISSSDSAALFRKIADNWIESMVLSEMAKEKLPQVEEIERRVEEYRNRLIVTEYLSRMRARVTIKVKEDSIRKFYDTHRKDMIAERPIVKGLFLKVPESESGIGDIRRCVFSATGESLDELDRKWASKALQYDYFEGSWVDWQNIAEQIPYRFYDPDAFVKSTVNFETTSGGTVYLLHISDYITSGEELPFEFASPRIRALLEQAKLAKYERDLVESLIKKAIADDRLETVGYDPLSHTKKK